jgi:hypothetical protein
MPFDKEHKGGRPLGTKNKNIALKDLLRDFTADNYAEFEGAFHRLNPKDKCATYLKVMEFVLPKVSSIKFDESTGAKNAMDLLKSYAAYN